MGRALEYRAQARAERVRAGAAEARRPPLREVSARHAEALRRKFGSPARAAEARRPSATSPGPAETPRTGHRGRWATFELAAFSAGTALNRRRAGTRRPA